MIDVIKISKALSNKRRVDIMSWLKNPEDNFPPHKEVKGFEHGVCLVFIKDKSGLSQSTISQYMNQLTDAGLTEATRIGKWTYYKRNEESITEYKTLLGQL